MNKALIFLFLMMIFTCFSPCSFCDELQVNEFTQVSGVSGFNSVYNILKFSSDSQMPLIASRDNLFLNATRYKVMSLKMKSDKSYLTGRIFFKRIGDRGFSYMNSSEFQTGLGNIPHTYIIDLSRNPNWFGVITQLMLSPVNDKASVEIIDLKFMEPGIMNKFNAYWQEFFTFEVPQLRTFNFIYGPRIGGISVNLYIYYLMIITGIIIFSVRSARTRNIGSAFTKSSRDMVVACLAVWVLLDCRAMFDQARSVVLDMQTYGGRTLGEKQSLTTLGDFYDFIRFSDAKLPERSRFIMLAPTYYYYDGKAAYYLYPKYISGDADFVLVYDPDGSLEPKTKEYYGKGYKRFSTLKEGQYILKK